MGGVPIPELYRQGLQPYEWAELIDRNAYAYRQLRKHREQAFSMAIGATLGLGVGMLIGAVMTRLPVGYTEDQYGNIYKCRGESPYHGPVVEG